MDDECRDLSDVTRSETLSEQIENAHIEDLDAGDLARWAAQARALEGRPSPARADGADVRAVFDARGRVHRVEIDYLD